MNYRIGQGYDVHCIIEGGGLLLGGFFIEAPFSLKGHSDADVLLHAITDALLGAIGAEDIGFHFSDRDPENKRRSSSDFVRFAGSMVKSKGYYISNLDTTIIAEQPKISKYRNEIILSIASMLEVEPDQVSVKATTTEKLGFTGRQEGIAANAIVLLCRDLLLNN